MAKITLRKTRETRVRGGHPWIYASEIERVEGEFENGDIVEVLYATGVLKFRILNIKETVKKEEAASLYEVIV